MADWPRRVRGMLKMGLAWGIGWAVIGGGIMEGIVDPQGRILDMWPQTLAVPGFFGGAIFSTVLWLADGQRLFEDLSVGRCAAWGAVGGLLVSMLPAAMVLIGVLDPGNPDPNLLKATSLFALPLVPLSALSAAGSLLLARRAERRAALDGGPGGAGALGGGD